MKIRDNLERIRGKFLARENARNAENMGVFAEKRTKKWYNKDTGEDTIREDDEIWRTTEEGNKIQFNEKGEVTGGNAYAVQKMKQAGAKVSPSAKTKKLTPKKSESSKSESFEATTTSESAPKPSSTSTLQEQLDKLPEDVRKKHDAVKELSTKHYEKGKEICDNYPALRSFTDHNGLHIEQVCEKSLAASDVIDDCLAENSNYKPCDKEELLMAARLHDIGMDGDDKEYASDKGNDLRKDHSINSAVDILAMRGELEAQGLDADRLAFLVFAHSKSSSGLSDLNSEECWNNSFSIIQKRLDEYNESHPNSKIDFDSSKFDDPDARATMRSEIAALRFGDANRNAPADEDNLTQGGGLIKLDTSKYDRNKECSSWQEEAEMMSASATYPDGKVRHSGTKGAEEFDQTGYSVHVYAGEGNLQSINCVKDKKGHICEEFNVKDGGFAPYCTFEAIQERLGEMATATGIPRSAVINLPDGMSEAEYARTMKAYKEGMKAARAGKNGARLKEIEVTVRTADGKEEVI